MDEDEEVATVVYADDDNDDDDGESADSGIADAITIDFITGAVSSSPASPPSPPSWSPRRRRGGSCTQHSRGRQQIAQSRHGSCQKQQRQQQQLGRGRVRGVEEMWE